MAQGDQGKVVICTGCTIIFNGLPHLHYGAGLITNESGDVFAKQTAGDPMPSIAVIIPIASSEGGIAAMVVPEGFPRSASEPVVIGLRERWCYRQANDVASAREMYAFAHEAFASAISQGSLARDYLGRWHVAGEA
jgi:hypothetical protein